MKPEFISPPGYNAIYRTDSITSIRSHIEPGLRFVGSDISIPAAHGVRITVQGGSGPDTFYFDTAAERDRWLEEVKTIFTMLTDK